MKGQSKEPYREPLSTNDILSAERPLSLVYGDAVNIKSTSKSRRKLDVKEDVNSDIQAYKRAQSYGRTVEKRAARYLIYGDTMPEGKRVKVPVANFWLDPIKGERFQERVLIAVANIAERNGLTYDPLAESDVQFRYETMHNKSLQTLQRKGVIMPTSPSVKVVK